MVAIFALLSFLVTGSYKGIVRHTGLKDAENVITSGIIFTVLLIISVFISRRIETLSDYNIPLSVVGANFFVSVFLLVFSRMVYKGFYYYLMHNKKKSKRVMIHGARSGVSTYDVLQNSEDTYDVLGFIDDRGEFVHKKIHRKTVYPPQKITSDFVKDRNIEEIIISKPEATPLELLELANYYIDLGLKVKTVPHIDKWEKGIFSSSLIREVNIEELLNRVPISIDNPQLINEIKDKTILITGAAGSIGSEIANQVLQYQPGKLILIDQSESALYDLQQNFIRKHNKGEHIYIIGNIKDAHKMNEYFSLFKPDIIYHAAAYKHVPLMESNPYEAVKTNVIGTKIIMDLAVKHKVKKFVMVSTDKAVNPTNVMGATKRASEIYANCLQEKSPETKFIITRFGNVLGSNGSVIPLFKKQIKEGGPLTVTHREITRFFMTIPEACQLVMEAGGMGKGGEIFVFDMGEPVKIFDLAVKMIHLSGKKYPEEIDIKITGLRPGEKLYEEVLGENENNIPTYHEKIKIANIYKPDCNKVFRIFELLNNVDKLDHVSIVKLLKDLIPEYKSNNSIYEKLDRNIKTKI
jgi:FlaA1/EpsC-like NDP-sugar epimerase